MSSFHRLALLELAQTIRAGVDSLVIFHRHPDGDAVGSGFALKLLLEAMGCRVLCSCDDEIPERLRFLVGDRQTTIQYRTLPQGFSPEQIIAVDTASPAQVGEQFDRYGERIDLMIDHHERGEMYADGWVDGRYSSAGEMIYELSRALLRTGRIPAIPSEVDRLLYAAISSDTGCFRYSNASPSAHAAAAELLSDGSFDPAEINHLLFEVKSEKLLLAERLGAERLQRRLNGAVGIVTFPASLKKEYGLTDEHLETLVDIPRSLEGVQVAVSIRQPTDVPVFRVSMRANGSTDVAAVCARFGGGGHVKAAGCTVNDPAITTVEQAAETIAVAIAQDLNEIPQ